MAARAYRFFAILAVMLPLGVGAAPRPPESEPLEITVLADEALRIPLTRLARAYASSHNMTVTTWFSRTGEMAEPLRQGSDIDLVLTADAEVLKTLEYAGQLDVYTTQAVVTTPLVLALPKEAARERGAFDLLEWRYREKTALPLVLVTGAHRIETAMNQQALTRSELLARTEIRQIPVESVEDAVAAMRAQNAAGLLLAVNVFSNAGLSILQRFPENLVAPASFRTGVMAGESMTEARQFLRYLRSPEAQAEWLAYGLTPADAKSF